MRRFAELYERLDRSTASADKQAALIDYLHTAPHRDAAWALWLLTGGKVGGAKKKLANTAELRAWVAEAAALPDWLIEDCAAQVGDLAETVALLIDDPDPSPIGPQRSLADWIELVLLPLANADAAERRAAIVAAWRTLPFVQRLVFNKCLTGSLRVGVSTGLVQQALVQFSGVEPALIAQRMLGAWTPSPAYLEMLLSPHAQPGDRATAYPFYLASPLQADDPRHQLGDIGQWLIEWKWDGIRVQLIKRDSLLAVWSRGEERLDGRFPEVEAAVQTLPRQCVIDGELLAWRDGEPLPFTALQTRIARRKPSSKTIADTPVVVLAYDLLEIDGVDLRASTLQQRRERLRELIAEQNPIAGIVRLQLSPLIAPADWVDAARMRDAARARGVEGLMLKRRDSAYLSGRKRGDWWKWKIDPLTVDAVLLYAQAGHGRRSTLYTDYTFGLWDGERLVPVAKAYSGLTDHELVQLDRWIRAHTVERFGPVRSVPVQHVFELGFEAVNRSTRHKSGIAVRFPRILRWRHDKTAAQADRLDALVALAR